MHILIAFTHFAYSIVLPFCKLSLGVCTTIDHGSIDDSGTVCNHSSAQSPPLIYDISTGLVFCAGSVLSTILGLFSPVQLGASQRVWFFYCTLV
jgi:hypothetical protein